MASGSTKYSIAMRDNFIHHDESKVHSFTIPSNSRNLLIVATNSLVRNYIAYVSGSNGGTIATVELNKGSDTVVSTSKNTLTLTFDESAANVNARVINIYGDVIT